MYRQGDVLLIPIESAEAEIHKLAEGHRGAHVVVPSIPVTERGPVTVLAYGEKTGHHHAIADPNVELLELHRPVVTLLTREVVEDETADQVDRFLRVRSKTATLVHEEHAEIAIPEGDYKVILQKEFDPVAEANERDRLRAIAD